MNHSVIKYRMKLFIMNLDKPKDSRNDQLANVQDDWQFPVLEQLADFVAELIAAEIIKKITEKEKRKHEKSPKRCISD